MNRRPRVTIHYAQTLDGRIATRTGQSRWISCDASLRFAHQLRADHQAVMVGVGTVVADDPRLTVRLVEGSSPLRVVVDSGLRIPLGSHVLGDGAAPTIVATTTRAAADRMEAVDRTGAELLVVEPDSTGGVSLEELLARLALRGVDTVLVEGGRTLITALLRQHLVDRLVVCLAPKLIGSGIDAIGDLGIVDLGNAVTMEEMRVIRVGEDLVFDGRPRFDGQP